VAHELEGDLCVYEASASAIIDIMTTYHKASKELPSAYGMSSGSKIVDFQLEAWANGAKDSTSLPTTCRHTSSASR